jgi:phytoene synthase
MTSAQQITQRSRSNLAFVFFALPREKRTDITTFYAFCRHIDDVADDPGMPVEKRRRWLAEWRERLVEPRDDEPVFARELRDIIARYRIDRQLFHDLLDGVEMDLGRVRFKSFDDLSKYCYRVASAVGLVSIEIFGYRNPESRRYARDLGMALQLTNIIRDVAVDYRNGERVYLPLEELERFKYSEEDLRRRRYNREFVELMRFQAERARQYYRAARAALPAEDRRSMVAAEAMGRIYSTLLRRIEKDGFRMFQRSYRLSAAEKFLVILPIIASNWILRG